MNERRVTRSPTQLVLEGIVTTLDPHAAGGANVAPMGPWVTESMDELVLRPFASSRTYANLARHPEGVFHVIDDVELLARAAIGTVNPPLERARKVDGWRLVDACRSYEFRIVERDDREERSTLRAEIVHRERHRDFFGFHRARHAVLEAAILATRTSLLPRSTILEELSRLATLIEKTGGEKERRAFALLAEHVDRAYEGPSPREADAPPRGESSPESRESTAGPRRVRVETGSRLHFGLIDPAGASGRSFGGVGLIVERPAVVVEALERDESATEERPSAAVPRSALRRRDEVLARLATASDGSLCRIRSCPPLHSGLGTGTQLALAIAAALDRLAGGVASVEELARRSKRGARSAIGVRGFEGGGFLVDGGKRPQSALAPLVGRYELPPDWRVVLVLPEGEGVSGSRERGAFASLPEIGPASIDRLSRIALLGMVPALIERDLGSFSEALWEFGCLAAEPFRRSQGGLFASAEIDAIVAWLRAQGIAGVAQSSWGPATAGFVRDPDEAERIARRLASEFGLAPERVLVTRARTEGARIERLGEPVGRHR